MRLGIAVMALVLTAGWIAPVEAYVRTRTTTGVAIEWDRRCIPFHLNERGSDDLPLEQVREAVVGSFEAWGTPDCGDLRFLYQGLTNDDRVGYRQGADDNTNIVVWRETPDTWVHPAGVIAVTTVTFCNAVRGDCTRSGEILDADIELNGSQFRFSTSFLIRQVRFDVRNTVTHEVGHLLGFDHSPDPKATMYASAPRGERDKATLSDDDVEALCDTYPSGEAQACEPVAVEGDYFLDESELLDTERDRDDDGCATGSGAAGPWWLLLLLGLRRRRR